MFSHPDIQRIHVSLIACRKAQRFSSDAEREERNRLALLPFGGYNMFFFGDFYQLMPVCGRSLFLDVQPNQKLTRYAQLGKDLWQSCITSFLELTENYRLLQGSVLAEFLEGSL
jgi:hypothetical protein